MSYPGSPRLRRGSRPGTLRRPASRRESLDDAPAKLWQAQLIEACDWEKGLGQGFGLTADGEKAAKEPALLARILAGQTVETELRDRPAAPTTYDRGERARAAYYVSERPLVTQSLMLVNIAVFLFGLSIAWKSGAGRMTYANGQDIGTLIKLGAVSGDALLRGEWWRLGSANFVHVGLVHLMLNVYCLGMVGRSPRISGAAGGSCSSTSSPGSPGAASP